MSSILEVWYMLYVYLQADFESNLPKPTEIDSYAFDCLLGEGVMYVAV